MNKYDANKVGNFRSNLGFGSLKKVIPKKRKIMQTTSASANSLKSSVFHST